MNKPSFHCIYKLNQEKDVRSGFINLIQYCTELLVFRLKIPAFPEGLREPHSGMLNSMTFRNTPIIIPFRTFGKKFVLKSLFLRPSGMWLLFGVLEWPFFFCVPEWLKNVICRTFLVLKSIFFCHSGMAKKQ